MNTAPTIVTRPLPGLPRRALSPAEQMDALRRVQAQADQRVKLGTQIFKAVEAQTHQHQATLDQIRAAQAQLHEEIKADASSNLQGFEQRVGQIDDQFAERLKALEGRLDAMAANWKDTEARIGYMMRRAEALLDQTRYAAAGRATPIATAAAAPATTAEPVAAPVPAAMPAPAPEMNVQAPAIARADAAPSGAISPPTAVPPAGIAPSIAPPREDAAPPAATAADDLAAVAPPVRYSDILRKLRDRQKGPDSAADHAA